MKSEVKKSWERRKICFSFIPCQQQTQHIIIIIIVSCPQHLQRSQRFPRNSCGKSKQHTFVFDAEFSLGKCWNFSYSWESQSRVCVNVGDLELRTDSHNFILCVLAATGAETTFCFEQIQTRRTTMRNSEKEKVVEVIFYIENCDGRFRFASNQLIKTFLNFISAWCARWARIFLCFICDLWAKKLPLVLSQLPESQSRRFKQSNVHEMINALMKLSRGNAGEIKRNYSNWFSLSRLSEEIVN